MKVTYAAIGAFESQVHSLVATGVLTPAQAGTTLSAAELLLKSLHIGGGF